MENTVCEIKNGTVNNNAKKSCRQNFYKRNKKKWFWTKILYGFTQEL